MPTVTEGKLRFTFADDWNLSKYDDWLHYRIQFIEVCDGIKAIDVLALEPKGCCWLLEIKDYREHARTKAIGLALGTPRDNSQQVPQRLPEAARGLA